MYDLLSIDATRFNDSRHIDTRIAKAPDASRGALKTCLSYLYKDDGPVNLPRDRLLAASPYLEPAELLVARWLYTRTNGSLRKAYGAESLKAARLSRYRCSVCSFSDVRVLNLDHVQGQVHGTPFACLCANCHTIKSRAVDWTGKKPDHLIADTELAQPCAPEGLGHSSEATMLSPVFEEAFAGCRAYYRDTVLSQEHFSMYKVGSLFREPTFCDATHKFGGLAATHRYFIVSPSARCIDTISEHPEWGLCIWKPGRIFKVIGTLQATNLSQIALLEIPEELLSEFTAPDLSEFEQILALKATHQFEEALQLPALPEHGTRLWLDRLELPVGINNEGQFFAI